MQGPEQLLRKASLERLSSPEQLDMIMRVTSPLGWVALVAIGVLIVAGIFWSILFDLSVKVDGRGYMVRGESVREVQALTAGSILGMEVETGQIIEPGTVIARLSLPDLENRLATARLLLADMEASSRTQSGTIGSLQANLQAQLARLQAERRQKEELVKKGLLTSAALSSLDMQITNIQSSLLQSQIGRDDRGFSVEGKRLEVKELEAKLANDSVVRSPFGGRVVALRAGLGQQVRAGDPLVNLEAEKEPLRIVGFIPIASGKMIQPGQDVQIAPSFVKPEDYGFMIGKVVSVSTLPATLEEIRRVVANEALAREFIDLNPFEVVIEPIPAPETPSGFKWTSSAGPPLEVGSGTDCMVLVVVEKRKPISFVIPTVKQTLGLT
ncbi:MAG: NHLP bacteriocin system secretion protein [Acidobacteria bacterium]|nr:NHLP bacteriocin system secretion protein [Thermoanaerobaculia bacterium]MDI9631584.1 NHLP bacteriocin system secretion protein [Acidobacteriota bacterium]MBP7813331.1 NHLP bacteriocin system secretion protein [Thermoanaerobaculia bacterium]NLN11604.1 NHLP bacteriocin system secretion protein [Acidobacteriota bacterium]HPA95541.1 NHLP bacteriocin system secretion protein [Thermoanaerobaculia bacterium]